ncbi:hypothetical protein [Aminobacter aminovorans]|uniref:hypothetical protein n=1 Tax=Aminobacter TaxID=31988 RepID=UPI00285E909C|nr:hypothetical protein [Aminobacter aminovorans]MDR7223075.1 hypothetical protein [Aminobacter aminovorans]
MTINRDSSKNFTPGGKWRRDGALDLFARTAGTLLGLGVVAAFAVDADALLTAAFFVANTAAAFAFDAGDVLAAAFFATGVDVAFVVGALAAPGFLAVAFLPALSRAVDFGAAFLAMMLVLRGSEFISLWAGRRPAARCRNSR